MSNTLGNILRLTSFGESHGDAIGMVLDGMPPGIIIDQDFIGKELERRRPGQSSISTPRNEMDEFRIISGVFENKSTGAPIAILIPNQDQRSGDYDQIKNIHRPGHADRVYDLKYGNRDHRGGGRASARITAGWVAAGALAKLYIHTISDIRIQAVVSSVHELKVENVEETDWSQAELNSVRCPDPEIAEQMIRLIEQTQKEGDSLGGCISVRISNCPVGLGEPLFDKLNAGLAKAIFSINAVKGLEFGKGFESARMKGSEYNDTPDKNSNHQGGITAGISNGKDIFFNVAFKAVASIGLPQIMSDSEGNLQEIAIKGRHDACVLPRAVPIVEAMSALVLADHLILASKTKL